MCDVDLRALAAAAQPGERVDGVVAAGSAGFGRVRETATMAQQCVVWHVVWPEGSRKRQGGRKRQLYREVGTGKIK